MEPKLVAWRPWLLALGVGLGAVLAGCSPSPKEVLKSAREHYAKQDYETARIQLKGVLQKNTADGEARLLLGRVLLAQNDYPGAEAEFRRALEAGVPEESVLAGLATALVAQGKGGVLTGQYRDARIKDDAAAADFGTQLALAHLQAGANADADAALAEALRRKPDHAPARVLSVRLRASRGQIDEALTEAESLAAGSPKDASIQALRGDLLAAKGRPEDAIAAWQASLAIQPAQPGVHAAVLTAMLTRKDLPAYEKQFADMKKALPNHGQTQLFEAVLASAKGDFARTRELVQGLLRGAPDNPRLLMLGGEAELKLNSPAQAEAMLSKAVQVMPDQPQARRLLATAQIQARQPAKALATLAPLLEGKKPDAETLALVGQAQMMAGNAKAADQSFAKAVEANPDNTRLRAARALTRLGQGDDASAMNELETLAAKDGGDRVDLALIGARLRSGDVAGASKAIDKLAAKNAKSPLPEHLRGLLSLNAKDRDGARKHFQAALQLDAGYNPALFKLSELDIADNKLADAKARLEAAQKERPKDAQLMLALSDIATQENKLDDSLAWLDKAIKTAPSVPLAHLMKIDRLSVMQQTARALEAAQAANTAVPGNLQLLERQGRLELMTGRPELAVATFGKMATLQPKSPGPQLLLADAYAAQRNNASVTAAIRKAQELAPESPQVAQAAIALAMREKKPDQALAIARKLQAQKPKDPPGWVLEGDIETSQKHWEPAVAAYRKAVELYGKTAAQPVLYIRLHAALRNSGKTAEADKLAADWQAANPKDASFQMHFGDEALVRKDHAEAEKQYRAALERIPENAMAMNNLAYTLALQGKPGSVEMAERAVKKAPNQASVLDTLAFCLDAEKQLPKALEVQNRAVALAPEAPQYRLQLARLKLKSGDKGGAREELRKLSKLGDAFPRQAEVDELMKASGL